VVVIDRRKPGQGSTLASTALILFELDTPLVKLADRIGGDGAERAFLRSYRAVEALSRFIAAHQIRCGWKGRNALLLAGDEMGRRGLAAEARYRARIGLPSIFLTAGEIRSRYGFDRTGAILSSGSAELNPVQLATGCLRLAQRKGARIYAPIDITEIHATSRRVSLATAGSAIITAQRVIFATGYETLKQIPADRYEIRSTFAVATKPLRTEQLWPSRCLIWEAADPYLYVRTTRDNRIVAGGEDEYFDGPKRRDRKISGKAKRVLTKLRRLLGNNDPEIAFAWAGTFAESPSGLPFMGEIEGIPGCLALLGSGGNGMTFAMVAAELAREWMAGREDPDADLFR
jgi:glycine/D-amino acid oxidase-like deaminating enzyme